MWDFDEDDCDCGMELTDGEHYGCDRCECCEDCPHMFECDGCGNLIYAQRRPVKSPTPRKEEKAKNLKPPTAPPEAPQKSPRKRTAAIVIGTAFLLACLLIAIFI